MRPARVSQAHPVCRFSIGDEFTEAQRRQALLLTQHHAQRVSEHPAPPPACQVPTLTRPHLLRMQPLNELRDHPGPRDADVSAEAIEGLM